MSSERNETKRTGGLPAFDPNPSAEFGREVLEEAGVPYALIGKVAMWVLLPREPQEWTKDVDFAVPLRAAPLIEGALARRGIKPRALPIGGLGVRHQGLSVDFIDRREGGLDRLFEEAIADATQHGARVPVAGAEVPLVTPEYLVALKVVAAELRDQQDAIKLLRALPALDLQRTRAILFQHGGPGSANLLDALARAAGRPDARPEHRNSG